MTDVRVSAATLGRVRGVLDPASAGLERTAGSAPTAVDGGDMAPVLTAMLSKIVGSAATMSEGLTSTSAQVSDTEADFWATDAAVATGFGGGRPRVD